MFDCYDITKPHAIVRKMGHRTKKLEVVRDRQLLAKLVIGSLSCICSYKNRQMYVNIAMSTWRVLMYIAEIFILSYNVYNTLQKH